MTVSLVWEEGWLLGGHWAALGNQWAFGITLEELWASNSWWTRQRTGRTGSVFAILYFALLN